MSNLVTMADWFNVVQRTAKFGIDESTDNPDGFYKWLAIWALDVVCEAIEYENAKTRANSLDEAGDVLWGIGASAMILGITQETIRNPDYTQLSDMTKPISYYAMLYSDRAKKIARDKRNPLTEMPVLTAGLSLTYHKLSYLVDLELALNAVNTKLLIRYPDGFSAKRSINRTV